MKKVFLLVVLMLSISSVFAVGSDSNCEGIGDVDRTSESKSLPIGCVDGVCEGPKLEGVKAPDLAVKE